MAQQKGKHSKEATSKKNGGVAAGMKTWQKVIIVVFAVVMVLSMTVPYFGTIFASLTDDSDATEETTEETTDTTDTADSAEATDTEDSVDDEATSDYTEGVPENLQSLAETYAPEAEPYLARLEDDENDLAAHINLANLYMTWGYYATISATTDEETTYAYGILSLAIEQYDAYVALHDSGTARAYKGLCILYQDRADEAIAYLEDVCENYPDSPLAWQYLGICYEQESQTDAAIEAYKQAVATDPDDAYGAKSVATQRLLALQDDNIDDSLSTSTDTSSVSDLTDQLYTEF